MARNHTDTKGLHNRLTALSGTIPEEEGDWELLAEEIPTRLERGSKAINNTSKELGRGTNISDRARREREDGKKSAKLAKQTRRMDVQQAARENK